MAYDETKCAHESCRCALGEGGGLKGENGKGYCSAGCATGDGCVCPECGCGMRTGSDEVEPGAVPPL